jgi:hypothetical protein
MQNVAPSSVNDIDIAALIASAEEIDRQVAAEPAEPVKPKRGRKPASTAPAAAPAPPTVGGDSTKPAEVEVIKPMSPQFPILVQGVVETGTNLAKMKLDWDRPDERWHEQFSGALARLIHHYMPVGSENADLFIVAGYLMMYVSANTMLPKKRHLEAVR